MKSEKPVISTKLGVVGFEVINDIHCIIKDDIEEYINSIIDLSKDIEKGSLKSSKKLTLKTSSANE